MNGDTWVALGALVVNVAVIAVGYGVLKGTVSALGARVTALETEMSALAELQITVARIGERQDMWIEQLKDLNASIRWMREPAGYAPQTPPDGPAPARRGRP